MEDAELGLSFDFEGGLDAVAAIAAPTAALPSSSSAPATSAPFSAPHEAAAAKASALAGPQDRRPGYRQTVCRHWLRSLCMKGDACGYLHQLDKARMPLCRFYARFGVCREADCIYKHTLEDIKECNMYKMGFCPNGPDCRYRHEKLPGPPPSVEENFTKLQQQAHAVGGGHSSRYHQPRPGVSHGQADSRPWQSYGYPSNASLQASEENSAAEDLENLKLQPVQTTTKQQFQPHVEQQSSANGPTKPQKFATISLPLPAGISRYFIVKSNNRENLELSVQRGVWATHRNNEAKLNEAFDTSDNVILVFSVNETRHFQGCARMMSKAGSVAGGAGWKHAQGTAHYGRNFRLKWLKLCELSFNKTRHLRNPYNENLPVKISRDCQELEPTVGEQLASLLYTEPDSDIMALAKELEAKREEQNAQGGASVQHSEDANIVPFEDNDDEQDNYDSEEDEVYNQNATASQARGRSNMGRGQMWRPLGKGGRGMRSGPGGRGMSFQHHNAGMGMNYGMGPGEGYNMPVGMFSAPPAVPGPGFPPYGPGFGTPNFPNMGMGYGGPMEGPVPGPVMMYPGRPPPPTGMFPMNAPGIMGQGGGPGPMMVPGGQGSMMEPVRAHFMGGPTGPTGPARPMGMPFRPTFVGGSGRGGRGFGNQPRRRRNDRAAANGRPALRSGPRQFPKGWQKTSPGGEGLLEGESEFGMNPPQWQQRRDGSPFKGNTDTGIVEESESEDEAPRRSRHGEGKKKKRAMEEDLGGGSYSKDESND